MTPPSGSFQSMDETYQALLELASPSLHPTITESGEVSFQVADTTAAGTLPFEKLETNVTLTIDVILEPGSRTYSFRTTEINSSPMYVENTVSRRAQRVRHMGTYLTLPQASPVPFDSVVVFEAIDQVLGHHGWSRKKGFIERLQQRG